MNPALKSTLLLAMGNDIMGDDGVALVAARILQEELVDGVDFEDTAEPGLALLDIMSPYDRVLLLDSVVTGRHPPGTILEFSRTDFDKVVGPSPHYAGLPEVLALAKHLDIAFPEEIRVLALEIENPWDFQEKLSPVIEQALPGYVAEARRILHQWRQDYARNLAHSKPPGKCFASD